MAGRPFPVVARLVNRSAAPVLVVLPNVYVYGYDFVLSFGGGLFSDGKRVPTMLGGTQARQWALTHGYESGLFHTLAPEEGAEIEDVMYRQAYVRPLSELKAALRTKPTRDLAPGEYTLRFSYGFRPEFHLNRD